jgi:hypothetical protein
MHGVIRLVEQIDKKNNQNSQREETIMERTFESTKTGDENHRLADVAWRSNFAAVFSYLARIWQKIRGGVWHVQNNLGTDVTKSLDIERIAKHLAVVKRAQEDGGRDQPPSNEEVPAGTQREIIAYFTNLRRRARRQATATEEKTGRSLDQIDKADSLARVRDIPAGCENKILRYVADFESHLTNTVEREQKQKRHYDTFRKNNGLDRVATYPGTAYLYYLIVPMLIVAIALALTSLVRNNVGDNSGVSVAWIATVSVLSVVVPFFLGDTLLRSINHVAKPRQFVGWIGAIVAIAMILGMAFYTDFHIAAVLSNHDASFRSVIDSVLAAPLDVASGVASWKGFGLVALTGLFTMLLAYRADDPYPGYGRVQRSYYSARDTRDAASSRLRKRINILIDEAEAEIATTIKGFKNKVQTYTRLAQKAMNIPSALIEYDVELEDACNMVLDRYRSANVTTRRSDAPLSFSENICFNPDPELDSGRRPVSESRVGELQTTIVELESEANLARQNLRALNLRMINSISSPQVDAAEISE